MVDGIFDVDRFDRRQDRDPRHRAKAHLREQIDRVLDDVPLAVEIGKDVDGGVGDEHRVRIRRHIHHEHMADAAFRA